MQQQLSQVRMHDDIFFLELCLLSIKAVLFCLTPPVMSPGLSDPQQPFLVLTGLNNSAQSSFPPPTFFLMYFAPPNQQLHFISLLPYLLPQNVTFYFEFFSELTGTLFLPEYILANTAIILRLA